MCYIVRYYILYIISFFLFIEIIFDLKICFNFSFILFLYSFYMIIYNVKNLFM